MDCAICIVTFLFAVLIWAAAALATAVVIIALFGKRYYSELDSDEQAVAVAGGIFFPLAWACIVIYWAIKLIALPFIAATKGDLRDTEERIMDRIETTETEDEPIEIAPIKQKFKAGDLIAGIANQTDKDGDPISYDHLYEGCKCKVLSINDRGSMKVELVNHADKIANRDEIGETFTAPARNFELVKKPRRKATIKKRK